MINTSYVHTHANTKSSTGTKPRLQEYPIDDISSIDDILEALGITQPPSMVLRALKCTHLDSSPVRRPGSTKAVITEADRTKVRLHKEWTNDDKSVSVSVSYYS